jgi:signal transduction histidine kinase
MERFLSDDRALSWLALGLATIGTLIALVDTAGDGRLFLPAAVAPFVVRVLTPRFPAWAALVATTVVVAVANLDAGVEGAFFLPIVAVLPVMATDTRRYRAYAVSALAVVAPAVTWLLASTREWTWQFWSMGALVTSVCGAVLYRQRTLTDQLLEARQQLTDQEVAGERRRIAREVHDLVGHSLSVVMLHVSGARHLLRRDVDEAERALIEAERAGRGSLAEIRRTVGLLRDADGFGTSPIPGVDDLAELVGQYRRGGLDVALTVRGATTAIDSVTGLTLYRVTQESLANVAKHAPDGRATVDIDIGSDRATIQVANSVRERTSASPAGGVGIVGMQERAQAIGGDLLAGPTDSGWLVTAWLPHAHPPRAEPEGPP